MTPLPSLSLALSESRFMKVEVLHRLKLGAWQLQQSAQKCTVVVLLSTIKIIVFSQSRLSLSQNCL